MRSRPDPLFEQHFRQRGISPVAGVDEAGVGAWAGPVVAAAVILPRDFSLSGLIRSCSAPGAVRLCSIASGNVQWRLG